MTTRLNFSSARRGPWGGALTLLLCAAGCGLAQAQAGGDTGSPSAGYSYASFTWKYRRVASHQALHDDQLKAAEASAVAQGLKAGLTSDVAKQQATRIVGFMARTGSDIATGTLAAESNTRVTKLTQIQKTFRRAGSPLASMNNPVREYWNGVEQCCYFDKQSGMVAELWPSRPGSNPFPRSANSFLEPYLTCSYPLSTLFAPKDLVSKSNESAHYRKFISDQATGKFEINGTVDLQRNCPSEISISYPGSIHKLIDYSVKEFRIADKRVCPARFECVVSSPRGEVQSTTEYDLLGCAYDGDHQEDLDLMGPDGAFIMDFRLGADEAREYRKKWPFPTLAELRKLPRPPQPPGRGKPSLPSPAAFMSLGAGVALLFLGVRQWSRSGRSRRTVITQS